MKRSARPLSRPQKQVKTKSRALRLLCGKEWLGGVCENALRHSLTVVLYRHADAPFPLVQRDAKMLRPGAQRILGNVEKM